MRDDLISTKGTRALLASAFAVVFFSATAYGAPYKSANAKGAREQSVHDKTVPDSKGKKTEDPPEDAETKKLKQLYKSAENALKRGDYRQCIQIMTEALAIKEDDEFYTLRARAHASQGDQIPIESKLALRDFTKAYTLNPKNRTALYQAGIIYMQANPPELEAAAKVYRQIIAFSPKDPGAHVRLADCLNNLKDYKGAIEQYSQHLKVKPQDDGTYFKRARAYSHSGQFQKTVDDYTAIINVLGHDDEDAYRLRAATYACMGQYDKALADYSHAISLLDDSPQLYRDRAAIYKKLHKDDLAAADMKKAKAAEEKPAIEVLK